MYATVRRYEGIEVARSEEIIRKIHESLVPRLSELPGFGGYYLIEGTDGVLASVSLFDDAKEAHESTRIAARCLEEPGELGRPEAGVERFPPASAECARWVRR